MRRFFAVILLLIPSLVYGQCGPGGCRIPQYQPQPQQAANVIRTDSEIAKATCRVEIFKGQGASCGSGVIVAKREHDGTGGGWWYCVLTNRHVVQGAGTDRWLTFPSGKRTYCYILGVDERADIAGIEFHSVETLPVVPLADVDPVQGETVWQIGYPHTRGPISRVGLFRGILSRSHLGAPNYSYTIATEQGDSGSPIINGKGQVVGLVWGGIPGESEAVGLPDLKRFTSEKCIRWFAPATTITARNPPPGTTISVGGGNQIPPVTRPPAAPIIPQSPPQTPTTQPPAYSPVDANRLDRIEADLAALKARQPVAGPAGPTGPAGERGPQGLPGPAGSNADVTVIIEQMTVIQKQMVALQKQIAAKDTSAGSQFLFVPRLK